MSVLGHLKSLALLSKLTCQDRLCPVIGVVVVVSLVNMVNIALVLKELQHHPCSRSDDKGDEFELAAIERKHILKVLQHTHGNKTETARLLKIGLATLYRKIDSYGIQ